MNKKLFGKKVRLQIMLSIESYNLIDEYSTKIPNTNKSKLIEHLIQNNLSNKMKVLQDKKRELAKEMAIIDQQMKDFADYKKSQEIKSQGEII